MTEHQLFWSCLTLVAGSLQLVYCYERADYMSNAIKPEGNCGCMMGPSGAPGVPGIPGLHGSRGKDGIKGDKGGEGERGERGLPGETGSSGVAGPAGERGKRGPMGPAGIKGEKGDVGDKGERGYPGFSGIKGEKGSASTLSKKYAFSVARSQKLGPILQDTTVTFDVIFANVGEGFDSYSSHFICKQNGTYLFTGHVVGQNNKDVYAWIMMNDKHQVPLHGDGRAGYGTGSQTIILSLRVDDHVWIQLSRESALLNDYSTFSGHFLFED